MKKMKNTVKGILVAGAILAMTATTALAMTNGQMGKIDNVPNFRYTNMTVERDGSLSFTLHNDSGNEAVFNGSLSFSGDDAVLAQSPMMMKIPVGAHGSTRVTTSLANGSFSDVEKAGSLSWFARIDGEGWPTYKRGDTTPDPWEQYKGDK